MPKGTGATRDPACWGCDGSFDTYTKTDAVFWQVISLSPIYRAYSSRRVKHAVKEKKEPEVKNFVEMAQIPCKQGYPWGVLKVFAPMQWGFA